MRDRQKYGASFKGGGPQRDSIELAMYVSIHADAAKVTLLMGVRLNGGAGDEQADTHKFITQPGMLALLRSPPRRILPLGQSRARIHPRASRWRPLAPALRAKDIYTRTHQRRCWHVYVLTCMTARTPCDNARVELQRQIRVFAAATSAPRFVQARSLRLLLQQRK
jgi:hypothetical protein